MGILTLLGLALTVGHGRHHCFVQDSTGLHEPTGSIAGTVRDAGTGEPLPGVGIRLRSGKTGVATGADGRFLLSGVAAGRSVLQAFLTGYTEVSVSLTVAAGETVQVDLGLEPIHEMGEVVITATRTVRSIADVPVRVEVIPEEEVEEKLLMTPASVAMLLNESTGMRVQTTSAASGSANLRIQGLDGRYTRLLTDGVPNFGGLASGFSITQMPPLNLRQVEVIKGASSALYGPDAIGGVVNFITRRPPERIGTSFSGLVNGTTASGYDAAAFAAARTSETIGGTLFASGNTQALHDVDGDRFGDIAGYDRFLLSGRTFLGREGGIAGSVGGGYLLENRRGGAGEMVFPSGAAAPYTERVDTRRTDLAAEVAIPMDETRSLTVKGAAARIRRSSRHGATPFDAAQRFVHLEAQAATPAGPRGTVVAGAGFFLEELEDLTSESGRSLPGGGGIVPPRSYVHRSSGFFVHTEWDFTGAWSAVAGARLDIHNVHGAIVTPRASVRHAPAPGVTLRLGAGTGFKAPTMFLEDLEERGFGGVVPPAGIEPERAVSGSFDVNWNTRAGSGATMDLNAAAYVTRLSNAAVVDGDSQASGGAVRVRNAAGPTLSRGGELSVKLGYGDLKLFLGYTFVYATRRDAGAAVELPHNPRHSAGAVLFYEAHESGFKAGLESYWTGRQKLAGNPYRSVSPAYVLMGIIAEKAVGPLRVFVNFENFLDVRQTRWHPAFAGDLTVDGFRPVPVYAPLEGRVVNGGLRLVY